MGVSIGLAQSRVVELVSPEYNLAISRRGNECLFGGATGGSDRTQSDGPSGLVVFFQTAAFLCGVSRLRWKSFAATEAVFSVMSLVNRSRSPEWTNLEDSDSE